MKIIRFLAVLALVFTLCSCTRAIKNSSDEIRLNSWSARLYGKSVASLKFSGDEASFIILDKNNKTELKISGTAFIDKNRIMIFEKDSKENYIFGYKLKDNILSLRYDGGKINLHRQKAGG